MIVQHKATGKVGVIPQNAPIPDGCEAVENLEFTAANEAAPPDRLGPYWIHPDGLYRLFPPNRGYCSGANRRRFVAFRVVSGRSGRPALISQQPNSNREGAL